MPVTGNSTTTLATGVFDNVSVVSNGPTATPTASLTPTATNTPTPTNTPTATATSATTPTPSPTPAPTEVVIQRVTFTLAGQPIAVKVAGDPTSTNNGIFYLHTDHLGSTAVLTKDSDGYIRGDSLVRYNPFGGYRGDLATQDLTDRGYTGHRENLDIGLIYMNARFYAPNTNRMVSPDTIVPDPANPQSYNRYSYVRNNPVNFTDPSGHSECGVGQYHCPGDVPAPVPTALTVEVGHIGEMPLSVIIMPPGSKQEAPWPEAAKAFDIVGIGADVAETLSAIAQVPALPDAIAYADIFAELVGSAFNGDTFYGYPEIDGTPIEGAPFMATIGQDVLVTAAEAYGITLAKSGLSLSGGLVGGPEGAFIGYELGNALDAASSVISAGYDIARLTGAAPNSYSFAMYFDESSPTKIPLPIFPDGQPGFAIVIYQEERFQYSPIITE